jgi:fructose-1,6-bisphosphatase/inositol monophosphatase family enzyme
VRSFGSGSLEFDWVAAGRLDACHRGRSRPVGLAARGGPGQEAGGLATALDGDTGWHVAAGRELHAEFARVVSARREDPPLRP